MIQRLQQVVPGVIGLEQQGENWDLVWEKSEIRNASKAKVLGPFCKLADAGPKQFLRFAEKHGVLGLCHHGFPAAGCKECAAILTPERYVGREPIQCWRAYARHVKAIRDIGLELQRGSDARTTSADWALALDASEEEIAGMFQPGPSGGLSPLPSLSPVAVGGEPVRARDQQITAISLMVNNLLAITMSTPVFTWPPRHGPSLILGTTIVFNLLHSVALELAYELISPFPRPEPVTCANCGAEFSQERRTPELRKTWCPKEECRKARSRYSTQCERARKSLKTRRSHAARR